MVDFQITTKTADDNIYLDDIETLDLHPAKQLLEVIDKRYQSNQVASKNDVALLEAGYRLNLRIAEIYTHFFENENNLKLKDEIAWKYIHARKYAYLSFKLTDNVAWLDKSISTAEILCSFFNKYSPEEFTQLSAQYVYCLENLSNFYYQKYEYLYREKSGLIFQVSYLECADAFIKLAIDKLQFAFRTESVEFRQSYIQQNFLRGRYNDRLAQKYYELKENEADFNYKIFLAQQICFECFKNVQQVGVNLSNTDMLGMLFSSFRLARDTLVIFPNDFEKYRFWLDNLRYALDKGKEYQDKAVRREVAILEGNLKYFT